jgi:hypothetical protein
LFNDSLSKWKWIPLYIRDLEASFAMFVSRSRSSGKKWLSTSPAAPENAECAEG